MIPRRLKLHNFLSYRECEVDFLPLRREGRDAATAVAVLWGKNGSGKSSLLEAMSWALWKQARGSNDDDIVRGGESEAVVEFEFDVGLGEHARRYLVIRRKSRRKSVSLDFFLIHEDGSRTTLTGGVVAETQAAINQHARMDYDTFVSSAFIAQGRADEFTSKKPAQRKEVFRKILGLEQWEVWSKVAGDRRKLAESEVKLADGSMADKIREVEELPALKERRAALAEQCDEVEMEQRVHEGAAQELRDAANQYEQLVKAVRDAAERGRAAEAEAASVRSRLEMLRGSLAKVTGDIERGADTRAGYADLAAARAEEDRYKQQATAAQGFQSVIQQAEAVVGAERVRIETELKNRTERADLLGEMIALLPSLETRDRELSDALAALDEREREADDLKARALPERQAAAEAAAEMGRCKAENRELKEKQDQIEGKPECPLCRTALGPGDVEHIRAEYSRMRKALGDRHADAEKRAAAATAAAAEFERRANDVAAAVRKDRGRLQSERQQAGAKLTSARGAAEQLPAIEAEVARLKEQIATEAFAERERQVAVRAREGLADLGYDAAAHAKAEDRVRELAPFEQRFQALLVAEKERAGIEDQIGLVEADLARCERAIETETKAKEQAAAAVAIAEDVRPRLEEATAKLAEVRQRLGRLREELGAADFRVKQLLNLEAQVELERSLLEAKREEAVTYRELEAAFGRDGVQTMLIQQALPELQEEANRRLDQMTGGRISVRLDTHKEQQSGTMVDSLEILVSDDAGTRDYAMYSGGEAFRVDFALRIALARLLAKRAGAELPTLIIDEGFGSQDAEGIDRLVEAINAISGVHAAGPGPLHEPFELILVVTHVEELRERFERRIEVTKDAAGGSRVRVV